MKSHILLIGSLSLSICLIFIIQTSCSKPLYWAKPDAEAGEFERDAASCQLRLKGQDEPTGLLGLPNISASIGTDSVTLEQCLAEKGWFLARKTID